MLTTTLSTPAGGYKRGADHFQIVNQTGIEGAWHVSLDRSFEADMPLPSVSASLEKQGLRLERTIEPLEKLFVGKVK